MSCKTISIDLANVPPVPIQIGVAGENSFRTITFDASKWGADYPDATYTVVYRRSDSYLYPVLVNASADAIVWSPTETDTAVSGNGQLEVRLLDGETIGKTIIMQTYVAPSLSGDESEPSTPAPDWVNDVAEDAGRAEAAVSHYPQIVNGVWYVWDAEMGEFVSTGISAQGEDGVSPTVTVEAIEGGHRVTITDADGAHTFDVMDGEGGSGSGAVESVNGMTGAVVLGAADVGALPNSTVIPTNVVLYTPQTLTDAQKEQTRENIGIEFMTAEDIEEMWGDIPSSDEYRTFSELMRKCELVTDSSPNLWNPDTVQNGLITVAGRVYTGGSYDNYEYNLIENVNTGDVIRTYQFHNDRVSATNFARITAFDANGTAVTSKGTSTAANTFTVPDGISSLWVCFSGHTTRMVIVNDSAVPTEYIPYGTGATYYVATDDFLPKAEFDPIINLPSDLYALVGYELNAYFENLVEDWTKYDFNVNCDKGMQLERGYRITPTADDAGDYTLSIVISNKEGSVTVSTTLHIIAASANSGVTKTVMVLGDSTTNNGIAVTKLNENFTNDVMHITLVGTRGTAPNLHEGRSGWKFSSYFNPPNAGDIAAGVENPWYNPTTQTFDANYYFTNTGITTPDWLFINLGINDVFGYETDSALETAITNCESLCDSMISSIKSASPSTKIGLCLTIPPNHSQDAFGKAYKCGQTRNRYKRNNLLWVHSMIETYSNRTGDGIYLIPIYTNLDTVYNMGMETMPVNARNTAVTYESPILNGGVHPVSSGYWQIADVYTAFLKGVE